MKPTKPPNGPEDEPGPVMMTQRRAGALLEALYLDVCRIATRLEALAAHFDHAALRDVHNGIVSDASALSKIRAKVLSGEIPIVLGEDVTSWERRQPLIAAIEANGHGNGHVDPPAKPRKPKRPDTLVKPAVPDDRDPWTAPVSRLIEHGLPDQTLKFVLDCEIMTVGELSAIDDFTPLEFSAEEVTAIRAALGSYRKLHPPAKPPRAPKRAFPSVADLQWLGANGKSTAFYGSRPVFAIVAPRVLTPPYVLCADSEKDALEYLRTQYPRGTKLKPVPLTAELARTSPALMFTPSARAEVAPPPVEVIEPPGRPDRGPDVPQDEPEGSPSKERTPKSAKRSQAV